MTSAFALEITDNQEYEKIQGRDDEYSFTINQFERCMEPPHVDVVDN